MRHKINLERQKKWINERKNISNKHDCLSKSYYNSSSICIPTSKILASTLPEKTPAQIFNVNVLNRKNKLDKNRRIRAMSLSLNPTIKSLILLMFTNVEDPTFNNPEKNVTNLP